MENVPFHSNSCHLTFSAEKGRCIDRRYVKRPWEKNFSFPKKPYWPRPIMKVKLKTSYADVMSHEDQITEQLRQDFITSQTQC